MIDDHESVAPLVSSAPAWRDLASTRITILKNRTEKDLVVAPRRRGWRLLNLSSRLHFASVLTKVFLDIPTKRPLTGLELAISRVIRVESRRYYDGKYCEVRESNFRGKITPKKAGMLPVNIGVGKVRGTSVGDGSGRSS